MYETREIGSRDDSTVLVHDGDSLAFEMAATTSLSIAQARAADPSGPRRGSSLVLLHPAVGTLVTTTTVPSAAAIMKNYRGVLYCMDCGAVTASPQDRGMSDDDDDRVFGAGRMLSVSQSRRSTAAKFRFLSH
jgi:hypothetical protein